MDFQTAKKNQSLTIAEEMANQTNLVMKPYANWEENLTPVPLSIAILGELVFISSKEDFSINKNPPIGGFKHIKYPDSFRACLMQVCNSGWGAFNEAHNNMDQIRLNTMAVPDYTKTIMKILFQGKEEVVNTLLPHQLKRIEDIANDCVELASATKQRFTDTIKIIHELLEACTSAENVHVKELKDIENEKKELELKKGLKEKAVKESDKAMKLTEEELKKAQEMYAKELASLPSGHEMMSWEIFKSLSFLLFSRSNVRFCLEQHRANLDKSRETYEKSVEKMEKDQKDLNDILIAMRNCDVKKIDFNTTIKMLAKGKDAMGRVQEQWQKMVEFFQMMSNIVSKSLSRNLEDFVSTSKVLQSLPSDTKLFSKDLLYNPAFQATSIASLVHMLSETYTEVSTKHIMNNIRSLGKLMAMDKEIRSKEVMDKSELEVELEKFRRSCDEAKNGILQLVLQNKEEFEKDSVASLEKLDQELLAILPADDVN